MTVKLQLKTLKLKGIIKNRNIMILVDSHSTHDCIGINFSKQLNLFVFPTKDLTVMSADEQKVKEVGRCHKVLVQIQKLELQTGLYTLLLDEMDTVLGAEWFIVYTVGHLYHRLCRTNHGI